MLKSISYLIVLFLFSAFNLHVEKPEPLEYPKYVKEITRTFTKEMEERFGLQHCGDGGSMPMDVEEIEVHFSTNRRASLEEAREIEVKAVEKLLLIINEHKQIWPYLREHPFTPERVGVMISFNNDYNNRYCDGTIIYMSLIRGKIYYRAYDPIEGNLIELFNEPYEEAKTIVQNKPLNRDLRYHQPNPYEDYIDQLFKAFAKEVKKKWGLTLWAEGGKMANGIEEVAVSLITSDRASIEKARKLQVEITERLLEIINSDSFLRPYLKEHPFKPNRAKVAITFKKWNGSHYTDGSVAAVRQSDNMLYYFTMPPPEENRFKTRPVPLSEESYDEAKNFVLEQNAKCKLVLIDGLTIE